MTPTPPIDTSRFPTGQPGISYEPDEFALLEPLEADARAYVMSFRSVGPIAEMVLAFGIAPIVAVYLVRYARPIERGELQGETEQWVIVGDLPTMAFETEVARMPAEALRFYCVLAEDWAYNVVAKADLSECYPIPVEPTQEHAEMLMSRVRFIREELIPLA